MRASFMTLSVLLGLVLLCVLPSHVAGVYEGECPEGIRIKVEMEVWWNTNEFPGTGQVPEDAHFGKLTFAKHADGLNLWEEGTTMTLLGPAKLAARGRRKKFGKDVEEDSRGDTIEMSEKRIKATKTMTPIVFTMDPDFPYLTGMMRMAPSPDYFLGISNLNLCEVVDAPTANSAGNYTWLATGTKEIDLHPYKAGVDIGLAWGDQDEHFSDPSEWTPTMLLRTIPSSDPTAASQWVNPWLSETKPIGLLTISVTTDELTNNPAARHSSSVVVTMLMPLFTLMVILFTNA